VIVYASSFDVSRPNGPGVNEQLFIMSMARLLDKDVMFLIPAPLGTLPGAFPWSRCMLLPAMRGRRPISWLHHQWSKLRALRKLEREMAPGLFILRPDVLPVSDVLFASRSRIPYCTKNAHLSSRERLTTRGMGAVFYRMHFAMLERLFRGALMVDVVSEIQRADLLKALNLRAGRVTVTDNAVDTRQFTPLDKTTCRTALGLERFNPLFGFVGNLAAERGALELVMSLPALLENFPDSGILIVEGDRKSTAHLMQIARKQGNQERIAFRGPVPLAAVPQCIAALDVAVSFRPDDGCSELKVRQYIACGRPVVASASVNRFLETEGLGSIVNRDDPAAIATALEHWARQAMSPLSGCELADKLSMYARRELDTDAANRLRISRWLSALERRDA
jgi:glycosyltransferase involved in cell wall biosynthesis